tara:strand:+ start:100 stop:1059 length:960 start_codon:yes stop_codon:yes gene_type:complete
MWNRVIFVICILVCGALGCGRKRPGIPIDIGKVGPTETSVEENTIAYRVTIPLGWPAGFDEPYITSASLDCSAAGELAWRDFGTGSATFLGTAPDNMSSLTCNSTLTITADGKEFSANIAEENRSLYDGADLRFSKAILTIMGGAEGVDVDGSIQGPCASDTKYDPQTGSCHNDFSKTGQGDNAEDITLEVEECFYKDVGENTPECQKEPNDASSLYAVSLPADLDNFDAVMELTNATLICGTDSAQATPSLQNQTIEIMFDTAFYPDSKSCMVLIYGKPKAGAEVQWLSEENLVFGSHVDVVSDGTLSVKFFTTFETR